MLEAGDSAPAFELKGTLDGETGTYQLNDYTDAGDWVVVTFYAFDFNPVCTEGACSLRDAEFLQFEDNLEILGISGDGIYAHRQFADEHGINYPLLSDTSKRVAETYGVVRDNYEGMERVHRRSAFVIDPEQTIRLAIAVDADSPDDVEVKPLVDAIRELRAT